MYFLAKYMPILSFYENISLHLEKFLKMYNQKSVYLKRIGVQPKHREIDISYSNSSTIH